MKRYMKFAGLVAIAFGLTACSTMYRNSTPQTALKELKPGLKVTPLWTVRPNGGVGNSGVKLRMALNGDTLYTADSRGRVEAINSKNGSEVWNSDTEMKLSAGPAVSNTTVIVASESGKVVALSTRDGGEIWSAQVPNEVLATPVISDNNVLIKTIDGRLFAFSADQGQKLWEYDHTAPNLILQRSSSPAVSDDIAYTGFADGKLIAVSMKNGTAIWQNSISLPNGSSEIERMIDIDANPKVSDGVIYAANYHGQLVAQSATDGSLIWQHPMSSYSGIALNSDVLFITDAQGYTWAFQRLTGSVQWVQKAMKRRMLTAPALMDRAVVVADQRGYVYWLSQTDGQILAIDQVGSSGVVAKPIVVGNTVYVLSKNGLISALQVSNWS